jgi:HPr kinase/phosphorylase
VNEQSSAENIHATAVAIGECGILIRGKAGSGKSSLAMALIDDPQAKAVLIGDDQVLVSRTPMAVAIRPAHDIAGMIEIRGIGVVAMPHQPQAWLGLVVDLLPAEECPRLPEGDQLVAAIMGREVPRLMLPIGSADGALRVRLALRQWVQGR